MLQRSRLVVATLLTALALGACTGEATFTDTRASEPAPTESDDSEATTPAEPVARRPQVGDCHLARPVSLRINRDDSKPIRCSAKHNAETYVVVNLANVELPVLDNVGKQCERRFKAYVGASSQISALTWTVMLTSGAGQDDLTRWARCDVIQTGSVGKERAVARRGAAKGELRSGVPAAVALCTTGWPPKRVVTCLKPHGSRVVPPEVRLGGENEKYPGKNVLSDRAKSRCEGAVAAVTSGAFRYGWLYPSQTMWRNGDRTATCWYTASAGQMLPALSKGSTAPSSD